MNKSLKDMVGGDITNIISVEGYWQLKTNKFLVTIYNPLKYLTIKNELLDINMTDTEMFINSVITKVVYKERSQLILELENNRKLYILLRDNDYVGPEALSILYNSGEIIVVQ